MIRAIRVLKHVKAKGCKIVSKQLQVHVTTDSDVINMHKILGTGANLSDDDDDDVGGRRRAEKTSKGSWVELQGVWSPHPACSDLRRIAQTQENSGKHYWRQNTETHTHPGAKQRFPGSGSSVMVTAHVFSS